MGHIRERKDKKGRTRYQMLVEVWLGGRKFFKSKTCNSEKEAKNWEKKIRYEIESGIVTHESLKNRKLSEAIDKYITQQLTHKKNAVNVIQHLTWWNKQLGNINLFNILPSMIGECRDLLLSQVGKHGRKLAPATVVKYLCSLSSVFEAAIKDWHWIEKNPIKLIRKPKISNARERSLNREECLRLLDCCKESKNTFLHLIVLLALSTGMRKGELLNLQFKDICWERKSITLHKTKNGKIRHIPLTEKAYSALLDYAKTETIVDPSFHLFPSLNPNKYMDIRTAWYFSLKKAGIKNLTFHDLRHSCGSFLAMSGASARDICEILGHSDIRMTQRYTHLSQPHLAEALERASEKFIDLRE
jgi:integrase